MNPDESLVYNYLRKRNNDVLYEPDGNIPPDFTFEKIGIEVRRLHKHYEGKGLEESKIPFSNLINNILSNYKINENDPSYWIVFDIKRPLPKAKKISSKLTSFFNKFDESIKTFPYEVKLEENLIIRVIGHFIGPTNSKFKLFGISDQNSGGFIEPLYIEEINFCIDEKEKLISNYHNKYQSWWLILVDHINLISSSDIEGITSEINSSKYFKKILILNSSGNEVFYI